MKKIILPLLCLPLALFAQTPVSHVYSSKYYPDLKENYSNLPSTQQQVGTPYIKQGATKTQTMGAYVTPLTNIGTTTYDLQTNGSLSKRLQLYTGGKLSYVWTKSDGSDPNFPSRYTGYNSFDGSQWTGQNTSMYEYDRSGWPSIDAVTVGTTTSELFTSHYAAAGGTNYAGGVFWYKNSGIGKTDFTKVIDLSNARDSTNGLLWPREASSDDKLYLIGVYQNDYKQKGVRNPVVFFSYNMTTKSFEVKNKVLPGYDSTRYGNGSADEYSLDARGKYVAVLIGGPTNDLALWKSSDSGKSFTKTVIEAFADAPYDSRIDNVFDTTLTNDGSGTVSLDADGVAHVAFSPMRILNQVSGDSSYTIFGDNRGIVYWNDRDKQEITVGGAFDYDHNGTIDIPQANINYQQAGYSGHNFCSYANIAIDPNGHIFVVYSAPHETDVDINGWDYRHVYVAAFDGTTWHTPQDVIQTWQLENAYPTVARDADGSKLHLVFMQDETPGIYIPNSSGAQGIGSDTMYYAAISTSDLLTDKIGLINLAINNNVNDVFSLSSVYPNPASSDLNVGMDLKRSSNVTVKLFDLVGKEMESQNYTMLPAGPNRLKMDVNTLAPGMYICNVTAGNYTSTQRIVIER